MISTVVRVAVAALALLAATPSSAEWLKASSRHFVVYADTDRAALLRQAIELERFDAAIRRAFPPPQGDEDAEANRVTVYVLPTAAAVGRLIGQPMAAGAYVPRITGAVAFTPRYGEGEGMGALSPRIVLFHEYAHHYLLTAFTAAFPAWFSEGFAEFASTFGEHQGVLWLGVAANHRGRALFGDARLSMRELFDPPARLDGEQVELLYGRGWLLTHYLLFNPARSGQLSKYLQLLNGGTRSADAAVQAFGDLRTLEAELNAYLNRGTLPAIRFDPASFPAPQVDIRPLSAGEQALMPLRIQSTHGVDARAAAPLYARAKSAASPFGGDPVAQGWLAEMAFDAGDLAGAEAAADSALAADPRSTQALLYKARVHLARAKATPSPAAWAEARGWIVRANRVNNNDAAALALYYRSFGMAGAAPTPTAVAGLYRAIELVPEDRVTRFLAARQLLLDGDTTRARGLLRALAYDPHAGADNPAVRLLAALDAGRSGPEALAGLAAAAAQGRGGAQ